MTSCDRPRYRAGAQPLKPGRHEGGAEQTQAAGPCGRRPHFINAMGRPWRPAPLQVKKPVVLILILR